MLISFLTLMGIVGIIIFHNFPAIVYMLVWYVMIGTCFIITEMFEGHNK